MTSAGLRMPQSADEFAACWHAATSVVNVDVRLPDWPFVERAGHVAICDYSYVLGSDFVPVLAALAEVHGDDEIVLVVAEPVPSYYVESYGLQPGFRITPDALAEGYWGGLGFEPMGDPTGAMGYTADLTIIVGSTAAWSVWGHRDWGLAFVHTAAADGPWLTAGPKFLPPRDALEALTALNRRFKPLTDTEVSKFLRNFAHAAVWPRAGG